MKGNIKMFNYSKTFLNEKRAEAFAENLKGQGAEDVQIWSGRDAFGQTEYVVKWNLWN